MMSDTKPEQWLLLLKNVSRSFYLSIRVLPPSMRYSIGLAYLLARAADTITDTRGISVQKRRQYLENFRQRLNTPVVIESFEITIDPSVNEISLAEQQLLHTLSDLFSALNTLNEPDRKYVIKVLDTLTQGMIVDLTTFPAEESGELVALDTAQTLDNYIYLVAGCVGEFWTQQMCAHQPKLNWQPEHYTVLGIRLGKALQLTNILRDVPQDLRIGRCYLPSEELDLHNLTPKMLLSNQHTNQARPILHHWLSIALNHFQAGEQYVLAIPKQFLQLRLAALWPLLLGLKTLSLLSLNKTWLSVEHSSKVSRQWVYVMLLFSLPAAFSNTLLKLWFKQLRKQIVINKQQ